MKTSLSLFFLALTLFVAPGRVWADRYPDFDDDAGPIIRQQPGLMRYIEENYKVRDTGICKVLGTDTLPPQPPFFFEARFRGSDGPYNITLMVQPGPPGHILKVINKPLSALRHPQHHAQAPAPVSPAPESSQPAPTPAPSAPAQPDADTPTGPIQNPNSSSAAPQPLPAPPSSTPPNLAPPADQSPH